MLHAHVVSLSSSAALNNAHTLILAEMRPMPETVDIGSDAAAFPRPPPLAVYACGSNYKFKCGLAPTSTRQNNTHSCECFVPPRLVPSLTAIVNRCAGETPVPGGRVRLAAAALHSLLVTGSGELWLWGCGSDGRLGFADFEARRARYLYCEGAPRRMPCIGDAVDQGESTTTRGAGAAPLAARGRADGGASAGAGGSGAGAMWEWGLPRGARVLDADSYKYHTLAAVVIPS